jgi:hypothetical protein
MAELLVRIIDKVNPNDPDLDLQCLKRGDVVVVQEDGWPWSAAELSEVLWKVMYFPGATLSAAESYLAPELPDGPDDTATKRRRAFLFNLISALPQSTFNGGDTEMLSFQVRKPPLESPDVFT